MTVDMKRDCEEITGREDYLNVMERKKEAGMGMK